MKQSILVMLIAAVATLLATSCGPSASEKIALLQAQKAKNDSVRIAELKALKEEDAYKASLRDSLTAYSDLLTRQQKSLAQLRANSLASNDQLSPTKIVELTNLRFAIQHSQDQISQLRYQLSH